MSNQARNTAETLAQMLSDERVDPACGRASLEATDGREPPAAPQSNATPAACRKAHRVDDEGERRIDMPLATEKALVLYANGHMLARLRCTPTHLTQLARGFLLSEGFVSKADQVISITLDDACSRADAKLDVPKQSILDARQTLSLATGCGGGVSRGDTQDMMDCGRPFDLTVQINAATVPFILSRFLKRSTLYRETRCVHSAALTKGADFVGFAEDVGRHNAVDKVIGMLSERNERLSDKGLITSGRVTLDIASKAARMRIPYIASRCAPSAEAVNLAERFHVAIIAPVGRSRLTVLCCRWRITGNLGTC